MFAQCEGRARKDCTTRRMLQARNAKMEWKVFGVQKWSLHDSRATWAAPMIRARQRIGSRARQAAENDAPLQQQAALSRAAGRPLARRDCECWLQLCLKVKARRQDSRGGGDKRCVLLRQLAISWRAGQVSPSVAQSLWVERASSTGWGSGARLAASALARHWNERPLNCGFLARLSPAAPTLWATARRCCSCSVQ